MTESGAEDTIVAVATPTGRGAVAIVRLSGAAAHTIAAKHVRPWPKAARAATLAGVYDADGALLDQGLVTVFKGPHSFTGEDTVEIATHGGLVVPTLVAAALIHSGARQALGGEFTRRAVLNGKIDLIQAEAIGDVIDARSRAMHGAAIRQLDGGLSRRILALRDDIIGVEAMVAYDIDFPEEDDGPVPTERITAATENIGRAIDMLLATVPAGELIREGALVVIAGPPNAGKSSLFNALLGKSRAIVTEVPGTTRDAIEAVIDTDSWPIRLVDTAGLRDTTDLVEQIGIEVSTKYLTQADVVLACGDSEVSMWETVRLVSDLTAAPVIAVRTKSDVQSVNTDRLDSEPVGVVPRILVSAMSGEGIPVLVQAITTAVSQRHGPLHLDAPILMRERQQYALRRAADEVHAFDRAWREERLPAPIAAVHLRTAAHELEDVIGTIDIEEIFDRLFRTFCVGK
jgi:tRNA modification GTPase